MRVTVWILAAASAGCAEPLKVESGTSPESCRTDDTGISFGNCTSGTVDDITLKVVVKDNAGPCVACTGGVSYTVWLFNPCAEDISVTPFSCLIESVTIDGVTSIFDCTGATPEEYHVLVPRNGQVAVMTADLSSLEGGDHDIEVVVGGVGSASNSFCIE